MRCNLAESEDQQVARYINGLNDTIQDRLMMQKIWSIDQAQALALKAERLVGQERQVRLHTLILKVHLGVTHIECKRCPLNLRQNNLSQRKL